MQQRRDASSDNCQYRICVEGILDPRWAAWFDALTITHKTNEAMLLTGRIDQAALYGIIAKRITDMILVPAHDVRGFAEMPKFPETPKYDHAAYQ